MNHIEFPNINIKLEGLKLHVMESVAEYNDQFAEHIKKSLDKILTKEGLSHEIDKLITQCFEAVIIKMLKQPYITKQFSRIVEANIIEVLEDRKGGQSE